jgi:undecaprenyl-diphosphatase
MEKLIELDKKVFLYFNSIHSPWLDPVMYFLSQTLAWLPLYILLLFLVFRTYKKDAWIILLGVGLTILLADQITTSIMKPYFARLRPSQDPSLAGMVLLVKGFNGELYKGGLYGFASSHAANTFGTATFFFLIFRQTRKWMGLLFLWAALMTYTRIYLGVHYPGDIIVGGIIGVLAGIAGYRLSGWITRKVESRKLKAESLK